MYKKRTDCKFICNVSSEFYTVIFILAKKMAEREGFEPSIPMKDITIFETVAFDHSAISPL